jgi:hypothetical protein
VITLLYFLVCSFLPASVQTSVAPAVLIRVQGEVSYRLDSTGIWQKGIRGTKLFANAEIKTLAKSNAIVIFTDGSVIRVGEKSTVRIRGESDVNGIYKKRDIQLNQGMLGFDVKANPQKQFRFASPTATAAIKGTEGVVTLADSSVDFALLSSESAAEEIAEITFSDGKKEKIGIGELFRIETQLPKKGIKLNEIEPKPPKFGDEVYRRERIKLTKESIQTLSEFLLKRGSITKQELDEVGFKILSD